MWSREEIQVADELRRMSLSTDTVLASDHHHQWVSALAGRQVLMGYKGWLASYGVDYGKVEEDLRAMYSGRDGAPALLARYGVKLIAVGPTERSDYGADESFLGKRFARVIDSPNYRVYRVP